MRRIPTTAAKAEFFVQLGFRRDQWEILAAALRSLAANGEVTRAAESPHGRKYVVVGRIQSPGGKSPEVRTIWIVDTMRSYVISVH
jgi:hypothetical protein